jgi:cysteine desulfurase
MAEVAANTYGNPSSLHTKGIDAEKLVKEARQTIADTLKADPKEIYFTSGGTESNNLAIRGYLDANPRKGKHVITTRIEHPSVLEVYRHLEEIGYEVDYLDVNEDGRIKLDELKDKLRSDTALISFLLVNNETGTIQELEEIASIRNSLNPQTCLHVDAVQAYGKMAIAPEKSGIGLLSVSSHKIHGPKGVGALYVSKKIKLKPILFGGGQETFLRSGTENVPGIAGFGLAAGLTFSRIESGAARAEELKSSFTGRLKESGLSCRINSPADGLPYILNVAFEDIRAEVLLHYLEQRGIYVSTGSACSSHKKSRSHVLTAMGVPNALIDGAIRFSFSGDNTSEDVFQTVEALKEIVPLIDIHRNRKMRRQ